MIQIRHRKTGVTIFEGNFPDVKSAIEKTLEKEEYVEFAGADLRGVKLIDAGLNFVGLSGADLTGAVLLGSYLQCAHLQKASLINTDLRYTFLSHSNLSGADLYKADLRDADLSYADMSHVHLYKARIGHTDLRETNLKGVDLSFLNLPKIKDIHQKMAYGHEISSTQARGEKVIALANTFGERCKNKYGLLTAVCLIYANSSGIAPTLQAHATPYQVRMDIRNCADKEKEATK